MPPFQLRFLTLNTQAWVEGFASTASGPKNSVIRY